jgi:polar amino acid transport system substrate-binding protein
MTARRTTTAAGRALTKLGVAASLLAVAACGSGGEASPQSGGSGSEASLVTQGSLTYCSDISAPPLTYYNEQQEAVGTEIELGDAIAENLGLEPVWKNVAFAGIIPALQGKQCDAIMSQLYIKPEREAIVDFVPYMYAGNTVMVPKGNPKDIGGIDDLCGLKVAAQTGTTVAEVLKEESAKCDEPIDIAQFGRDSEAQQQLKIGIVDAYGSTVEVAGYAIQQQPDLFETAGEPFNKVETGIATLKDNKALHEDLTEAFAAVREDGTYDEVLERWNLTADALPAS